MIAFTVLFKISFLDIGNSIWGSSKNPNSIIFICVSFLIGWDSLHAKLNSYYKVWSYKKNKHKKIKAYRESI